ncbi:MAG: delta-60 repeat domain-containing protein [Acidobacteriota bacterium]
MNTPKRPQSLLSNRRCPGFENLTTGNRAQLLNAKPKTALRTQAITIATVCLIGLSISGFLAHSSAAGPASEQLSSTNYAMNKGANNGVTVAAARTGETTGATTVAPASTSPSCTSFGLDPTFGVGGMVVTSFPGGLDTASDIAVQTDGKIVVAGSSGSDYALTRYNIDGSLDATFGNGGRVSTDFPTGMGGFGTSMVIQPDGKIVVAGSATDPASPSSSGFALVRYNTNGSLDTSFDGDGRVVTGFAGSSAAAEEIALQPDGKLVLAGTSRDNTNGNSVFALSRYNTDGSLDNSFDTDGRVTTDIPGLTFEEGYAVAIQANGRIVAAGQGTGAFVLTRYNIDGSLDTGAAGDLTPADTFGTAGIVTTAFGGTFEQARSLAIQADGKIIAAGQTARSTAADDNFALARYNAADGSLDTTFDTDGKVTTDFGLVDGAEAVVIQPDGQIVAAGRGGTTAGGSFFALARYNLNGSLDNSFDSDGKVLTDFSGGRFGLGAQGVALQTDGRIVAAGDANISGQRDFGVARYNPNGSLDLTGFGILGQVITDFPLNEEGITGMVVQPDGKIVVVGRFNFQVRILQTQDLNFQLARYNSDGTLDTTFGSGGLVSTDFAANSDDLANAIALQSDGRLVVVGQKRTTFQSVQRQYDVCCGPLQHQRHPRYDLRW